MLKDYKEFLYIRENNNYNEKDFIYKIENIYDRQMKLEIIGQCLSLLESCRSDGFSQNQRDKIISLCNRKIYLLVNSL
jgi:hypothetical protein